MRHSAGRYLAAAAAFVLTLSAGLTSCAAGELHHLARGASDSLKPLLVAGELSLLQDGQSARPEMLQGIKALAATTVITEGLKDVIHERRPNGGSRKSFPSGHTSTAFAMATVVSDYQPQYKWIAYGAAAAIGWSRVELDAHNWGDVAAGAALGYVVAKRYTGQHFVVTPDGIGYQWAW